MKSLILVCLISMSVLLTGCATTKLTAMQRRTFEAKELTGTYDDAYKSTLQVLQDNGYIIKNSDHASGVIQGETGVVQGWFGRMDNTEITATLEQFGEGIVKERLTIVGKVKVSSQYGTHENSRNIDDPELFQKLYSEIQKEMFIRKNLSK